MNPGLTLYIRRAGYRGRSVLEAIAPAPMHAGSLVALVGPNAAGKSTLLKAIAGQLPADGTVQLDGVDMATLPLRERQRRIGYVPQALPQPTTLLASEIWHSALRASRGDWSAAQRHSAIEQAVHELGLAALALRRMDELSGGQRQIVGLAQAIARAPRVLLLDEPTSALDLRWQLTVLDTLRRHTRAQDTLCLIALHDLNLAARFCDQMLVLDHGRLAASGPPSDVLTPALLQSVYGVRARLERCSQGHLMVLADGTGNPLSSPPHSP